MDPFLDTFGTTFIWQNLFASLFSFFLFSVVKLFLILILSVLHCEWRSLEYPLDITRPYGRNEWCKRNHFLVNSRLCNNVLSSGRLLQKSCSPNNLSGPLGQNVCQIFFLACRVPESVLNVSEKSTQTAYVTVLFFSTFCVLQCFGECNPLRTWYVVPGTIRAKSTSIESRKSLKCLFQYLILQFANF